MSTDKVHGAPNASDRSIVVRCSCAAGCIAAFDRWGGDDGPEFYGELYTGFHPTRWRDRLKNAWTCLRGREMVSAAMILNDKAAQALGEFMQPEAPREMAHEIDRLHAVIRDVLALKSSYDADRGVNTKLVNNMQAREMLEGALPRGS